VTPAGCAGRMRPRRHEEAHHLPRGKHTPYVPINIPVLKRSTTFTKTALVDSQRKSRIDEIEKEFNLTRGENPRKN
jgi:hypothetical protein